MKGNIKRLVATSLATAMLAVSMIAPAVSAAPPNWDMHVTNYAPEVKPGNNAAFLVEIWNNGPSNISALYLDDGDKVPLFASTTQGTCSTAAGLLCSFGAVLPSADPIEVFVVYATPSTGSAFNVTFQANTNGNTSSDNNKKNGKPGTSRGDTLERVAQVKLNNSPDFGGGYVFGTSAIANSTSLSGGNPQSTQLGGLSERIYATVLDGDSTALDCGSPCTRQLGENSEVNVADGAPQTQAFRITITIRGGSIPNPKPSASSIIVVHERDNEAIEIIGDDASERCDSATNPSSVPAQGCVIATWIGNGANANLQIVVWTFYNGKFRGSV